MQSVQLNGDGMILFSEVPVAGPIREELERDLGAVILDDVSIPEIPERGGFLCVSLDDPKRFLVVDRKEEAGALGFEPTGKPYGLIRSEKHWRSYLSGLKALLAIAAQTDETDTDEGWESVMANLRRPE